MDPPPVPLKPYPPKIEKEEPSSPFQLNFPSEAHNSPSRIPRPSNVSTAAPPPSSRLAVTSIADQGKLDAVDSRDSTYSMASSTGGEGRLSGVVTTANAISIQRATARTRAVGEMTSSPSPRGVSVEKGIGVKTRRRKSKESTTTKRSSRPSSTMTSTAEDGKQSETFNSPDLTAALPSSINKSNVPVSTSSRIPRIHTETAQGSPRRNDRELVGAVTSKDPTSSSSVQSKPITSPNSINAKLPPLDLNRVNNLPENDHPQSGSSEPTFDSLLSADRSPFSNSRFLSPTASTLR